MNHLQPFHVSGLDSLGGLALGLQCPLQYPHLLEQPVESGRAGKVVYAALGAHGITSVKPQVKQAARRGRMQVASDRFQRFGVLPGQAAQPCRSSLLFQVVQ